ncbi:transcription termination/antitermination protein NusG [Martelella mediterranea]|uniref:Transcriptional antiterminator NusG n=1 Tax=Martelella mediterranea TaxID=293089 RepID=A0A4R3NVD9_9HYPH|nr:transcription termination/antitermination NusG family protein [Martelella mediterranea]TCT42767.1 transcriptional antiterminator NusG [Martelella mediterranea]
MTEQRHIGDQFNGRLPVDFEQRMRQIRFTHRPALAKRAESDSEWMVACVRSGREMDVEKALSDAGVEAIVPIRKGKERRRRNKVIPPQNEVLMSGYVLFRCCYSVEAMSGLLSFEHVVDVLGGWEKPFTVNHEKVRNIMQKAHDGRFDYERVSQVKVAAGDKVRIVEGLFAGLIAEVMTPNGKGKGDVVVEVDMFGQKTPTILPLAILEKL